MRTFIGTAILLCFVAPAFAEPPRLEIVRAKHLQPTIGSIVNSRIIFLNRCTGGCAVHPGYSDSRTNTSGIVTQNGTLSAFSFGNVAWTNVVNCMKNVWSRFNVTITDVDPGPTVEHFEIMIGGSPEELGLSNVGGIAEIPCAAPGSCLKFIPNALVFAFSQQWGNDPNRICAVAAQEIGHTFALDHVADETDPMTYYFGYTGIHQYKDGVHCGSDCKNGVEPLFNQQCSGSGGGVVCPADQPLCQRPCASTNTLIQNDVQMILGVFGPAGAVAPALTLTNPANGSTQPPGFAIHVDCTSSDGVQEVDLSIDGVAKETLTAPPFDFKAPANIADGPHTISVLCASNKQATTIVKADVTVAAVAGGCVDDTSCLAGYVCVNSECVAPPLNPPGGALGTPCTGNSDCASGQCASDTSDTSYCVEPCDSANACPTGFSCEDTSSGGGVCWPGPPTEGGSCNVSKRSDAGVLVMLGLAAVFVTRRRRKSR